MRHHPCSGYLLPAALLAQALEPEYRGPYMALLKDGDFEEAANVYIEHKPDHLPAVSEIFGFAEEDYYAEDIELDVPYARFEDADLYHKVKTGECLALESRVGQKIENYDWARFG